MFYFVASDGTENKKISITFEDKEWFFTLDKTYEFGNKFYDLLEKDKSLTIQANLYSNPLNAAVMVDVNLSEEVPDISISVEAGDIIIYSDSNLFNRELKCFIFDFGSHVLSFSLYPFHLIKYSSFPLRNFLFFIIFSTSYSFVSISSIFFVFLLKYFIS